ncbi:leucine-rich repeat domain-containing protein [Enterococcus sp. BWM-S5]|uniref:Leucine-rich repeat domain-containing protein n=1 Tax=Enterococcus larvae TaxID=2794352 RepID=A0ABS4CLJ6_9ENTE|nr:leucine-rich repeat domain-containing protein [Enterococcus larvae]MBP1047359.1 leucine-rich repeat domain-containing protein [Enterococcus larvae]
MEKRKLGTCFMLGLAVGVVGLCSPIVLAEEPGVSANVRLGTELPVGSVALLPEITQSRLGWSPYNYTSNSALKDSNWAQPDKVTTSVDDEGNILTAVTDTGTNKVYLHAYQKQTNTLLKTVTIDYSTMPLYGHFYFAPDGYCYLIVGQANSEENNDKTVIEVRKYDQEGNMQGVAELKGGVVFAYMKGITEPFKAGQTRVALEGTELAIHTNRMMYKDSNGVAHQSNLIFSVDTSTMSLTNKNWNKGYQSHSMNQFVQADEGKFVTLGHGDAYGRGIELFTFSDGKEYMLQPFDGAHGANFTGATMSGFEITEQSYLVSGRLIPQSTQTVNGVTTGAKMNAFVLSVDKATMTTTFNWLTKFGEAETAYVGDSRLIKINNDRYVYLYTVFDDIKGANPKTIYTLLDGQGTVLSEESFEGMCFTANSQPIVTDNKLTWVSPDSTSGKITYLYQLDITNPNKPTLVTELSSEVLPEKIEITANRKELAIGETAILTAVVTPDDSTDKSVVWSVDDEQIAAISADGVVTAKAAGIVTITAKTHNGKTASVQLTVIKASTEDVVDIPDTELRKMINTQLRQAEDAEITKAQMEKLVSLSVPLNGLEIKIKSLTGLEYATNLSHLTMYSNEIESIEPLRNLTKLTYLRLHKNNISDLSPLTNLVNLTNISLDSNQISDLTPLKNLTKLTILQLSNNQISDITPLRNLTKLGTLNLAGNSICDFTPMENITATRFSSGGDSQKIEMTGYINGNGEVTIKDPVKYGSNMSIESINFYSRGGQKIGDELHWKVSKTATWLPFAYKGTINGQSVTINITVYLEYKE